MLMLSHTASVMIPYYNHQQVIYLRTKLTYIKSLKKFIYEIPKIWVTVPCALIPLTIWDNFVLRKSNGLLHLSNNFEDKVWFGLKETINSTWPE